MLIPMPVLFALFFVFVVEAWEMMIIVLSGQGIKADLGSESPGSFPLVVGPQDRHVNSLPAGSELIPLGRQSFDYRQGFTGPLFPQQRQGHEELPLGFLRLNFQHTLGDCLGFLESIVQQ